jgi:hypothetical protein
MPHAWHHEPRYTTHSTTVWTRGPTSQISFKALLYHIWQPEVCFQGWCDLTTLSILKIYCFMVLILSVMLCRQVSHPILAFLFVFCNTHPLALTSSSLMSSPCAQLLAILVKSSHPACLFEHKHLPLHHCYLHHSAPSPEENLYGQPKLSAGAWFSAW